MNCFENPSLDTTFWNRVVPVYPSETLLLNDCKNRAPYLHKSTNDVWKCGITSYSPSEEQLMNFSLVSNWLLLARESFCFISRHLFEDIVLRTNWSSLSSWGYQYLSMLSAFFGGGKVTSCRILKVKYL